MTIPENEYGALIGLAHAEDGQKGGRTPIEVPADVLWELLLIFRMAHDYVRNSRPDSGCSDEEERTNEGRADNLGYTIQDLMKRMDMPADEWEKRYQPLLCPKCGKVTKVKKCKTKKAKVGFSDPDDMGEDEGVPV
jgi:hypothetical protein